MAPWISSAPGEVPGRSLWHLLEPPGDPSRTRHIRCPWKIRSSKDIGPGDFLKWTMENRDNDMRNFMKLMAQQLDFTMISPWFTWQEILGPRPRKQPLLLGCHIGLSVSWAHDSEDPKAKTQDPSHFTNLLQTIHRDQSILIMWSTQFFRPHQGSQPRKKNEKVLKRRAHESCHCHLVKVRYESSYPKRRMIDTLHVQNSVCLRMSVDVHGMWR